MDVEWSCHNHPFRKTILFFFFLVKKKKIIVLYKKTLHQDRQKQFESKGNGKNAAHRLCDEENLILNFKNSPLTSF